MSRASALAFALLAAGCSLVQTSELPEDLKTQAQRLSQTGQHSQSAQAYADLAIQPNADRDSYLLKSAREWLAAGHLGEAKQAFAAVSADARARLPAPRALVVARIAVVENDGPRAIRELDEIAVPTVPDQAQDYWELRGDGAFLAGRPPEGVQAYVERERYLADAAGLRASRETLYARLRTAAERGNSLKIPLKADAVVTGWLDLAPIAVELARNPLRGGAALGAWKQQFPAHPAIDSVLTQVQTQVAAETHFPNQIALLLPLSGRSEPIGVAVRDGFIAAYLQQDPATRPRLKIYDVAADPISAVYNRATDEGAGFVVGPLIKEEVAAIAPLSAGRAPVLALNFLGDSVSAGHDFYQFALLPEDEARIVARRLVADGKSKGVAIIPGTEWGNRVGAAFTEELTRLGGAVLDSQRYENARADFSDIIRDVLQVHFVKKGEPSTHRTDAEFIFIAGNASAARLIMPQLKFFYAGDLPVYSTADSFEPDPSANQDLEGMIFPDMPWMVSADSTTAQVRDELKAAWPTRSARRGRLYAFGFDAYRLVPALKSKALSETNGIAGMTGQLHLDEHNRVRRELEWVQMKNGVPTGM
jgi:outer membrane PBP1 activator LpoA protein